jgi:hypothetical protein
VSGHVIAPAIHAVDPVERAGFRSRAHAAWLVPAVLGGLMVVEGARQGGFWPADAVVVAVVVLAALVFELLLCPPDRRGWAVLGSVLGLALLWLVRDIAAGTTSGLLPFGASLLGFGASFVAVRPLSRPQRAVAGQFVSCLGVAAALIGFVGLIGRRYPMAMPAQGLWRLSTTLTYSDAAGLALAVCLLVSLAGGPRPWISRLAVCLCSGGLLAAQSRGALIACACAVAIVPWAQFRTFRVPLLAGIALGITAVATSTSTGPVAWLAVVLVLAVSLALAWPTSGGRRWSSAATWLGAGGMVLLLVAASLLVHHELALRALAPSDQDRAAEWTSAFHQFESSPIDGVGPDRILYFQAADGDFAHFAHNEYLQIAADVGLLGLAALAAIGVALARTIRRVDLLTSCSTAALVCWSVGGGFDFDWHLPFIGLLGGWVAGMAATTIKTTTRSRT